MSSLKARARSSGSLYLLASLTGAYSFLYVPSTFIVRGNAEATVHNILTSALTYRLGMLSGLISDVTLIFLGLSLYDLLKDVDRKQARLLTTLLSVGAAVGIANVINLMAPLMLLNGAQFRSVFTQPQLDALVLGSLSLRNSGLNVAQIFWGLWLLPFGILVVKSGFFPKILGRLLMLSCAAYLVDAFVFVILPGQTGAVTPVLQPIMGLGEMLMIFWLLVKGANAPTPHAADTVTHRPPSDTANR